MPNNSAPFVGVLATVLQQKNKDGGRSYEDHTISTIFEDCVITANHKEAGNRVDMHYNMLGHADQSVIISVKVSLKSSTEAAPRFSQCMMQFCGIVQNLTFSEHLERCGAVVEYQTINHPSSNHGLPCRTFGKFCHPMLFELIQL